MKKYCLIVKSEEYSGICFWVDEDFDEDWDSPILKDVLKDFQLSKGMKLSVDVDPISFN